MDQDPSHSTPVLAHADDFARKDPTKAVATAFAFGFLLHLLPLRAIAAALVWLALALVRPALLLLGFVRVVEFARDKSCCGSSPSK